jgi:copper chaperone CopZ
VAVEGVSGVDSVETDMDAHTVTVGFDDDDLSVDTIIAALMDAGYTVPKHAKVQ